MGGEELQERYAQLRGRMGVPEDVPLTVLGADWQDGFLPRLDTSEGQAFIEPHVEGADLVLFDNRSCLFDPEGESDPTAWQPAQDYLLSLRRRGKAVIVAHHSNRLGGARGHSKPEDAMNLLVSLARPEDYSQDEGARFVVTFEKSRGAYGEAVAPFLASLKPDGWLTDGARSHARAGVADRLLGHLRLADQAGDRPKSANAGIRAAQVNRQEGLRVWGDLLKAGTIAKHHEGGFYVP
jgi:hypothetical protein